MMGEGIGSRDKQPCSLRARTADSQTESVDFDVLVGIVIVGVVALWAGEEGGGDLTAGAACLSSSYFT